MIRSSTFDDALTTLCRNLRLHTCMTSLRRISQRINIGHMFKKEQSRTSYVLLVNMNLELDAKFLEILEAVS